VLDLSKVSKNVKILRGIAIVGHCAYLTDNITASQSLLHIVDIRDASQPRLVKSVDPLPDLMDAPCSSGWADSYQDVVVEGDYLFIGNYGQIECLDVSDPENPTFYDRIAIGYQWSVGLRWGEHLFVPGLAGLYAVDAPCSSQVPTGAVQGWLRP
jgi:hypothetical protein